MKFTFKNCLTLFTLIGLVGCQLKNHKEIESEDLDMDGMEEAMRQEFKMTRDPLLNIIPRERLEIAKQQTASLLGNANLRVTALSWQERGPSNIGGRTRAILVDSRDASGNTVFAGSVSGGIFKTTNFVSATPNWAPINDQLMNLAITVLVQDRTTPATMYAGTGEGWFNIDAVKGAGVFKSTDGGTTWNQMASTAGFEYVQDMIIDNNGNLYVSLRNQTTANRGVMRSIDGGITWTQVLGLGTVGSTLNFTTGRAADLEVASNGDLYATLGIFTSTQVFKSAATNGANTGGVNAWIDVTPPHTVIIQRGELVIAPSNPQRLYLLVQDSASSQVKSIYRSSNGGVLWDSLGAPSAALNGSAPQTWYNLTAAVDPTNPDILVVGAFHIARSIDAGNTFTDINSGIHVDQHALVYVNASTLLVGNDGGIYYSTNVNGSPTFSNKNNGYNVTQFYGADFHPTLANYFLAGAQDNNTQKFITPGINSTSAVVGGDGGFPHIDQTDGLIQIASTTGNNYYRSTDGGNSFTYQGTVSNNRGQFINPTDYDDNANTLYAGDDAGQYYYINNLGVTPPSGSIKTLTQIGSGREVTALKVDPFTANTVWLGTNSIATGVIPAVMKVTNANSPSASVTVLATLTVPAGAYISSVDVDPSNGNHLLATLSNYGVTSVFESTDGGTSWHTIEGNLPDMPVYWGVFAPTNGQLNGASGGNGGIILGTELGIWTTSVVNGASTTWAPDANFPRVRTDMLKWRPSDFTLLAATHGRGLWTTTIPTVATGIPTVPNTKNFIDYITASKQQLLIKVGNLATTKMEIQLFDMKGRLMYSSKTGYSNQTIPINSFADGAYVLKVYGSKNERYTQQFIK